MIETSTFWSNLLVREMEKMFLESKEKKSFRSGHSLTIMAPSVPKIRDCFLFAFDSFQTFEKIKIMFLPNYERIGRNLFWRRHFQKTFSKIRETKLC